MQNPSRTVDATPPFDARLSSAGVPNGRILCDNANLIRVGGWHVIQDPRAANGRGYCRAVVQESRAYMELRYVGRAVDILLVKGPRGGILKASIDGGTPTTVDEYRPPSDPDNPDQTGRHDLTFGKVLHVEASSWGEHVLRVTAPKATVRGRDMAYIDGFRIIGGSIQSPNAGGTQDVSTFIKRDVAGVTLDTVAVVLDTASPAVEFVVEVGDEASVWLAEASGEIVVEAAETVNGVAEIAGLHLAAGTYLLNIEHTGITESPEFIWEIVAESR
jgi:hypothetical protein